MDELEVVQSIGNEVCEDCGTLLMDCGYGDPTECPRILNALNILTKWRYPKNASE